MRNWDSFVLMSTAIISIILFASGKVTYDTLLDDINTNETLAAIAKTLIAAFVSLVSLVFMVIILLVDVLLSLIFSVEFPIMNFLYEHLYLGLIRGWYWDTLSGNHIFLACIILFGMTLIYTYLIPSGKSKPFIYHKNKTEATQ